MANSNPYKKRGVDYDVSAETMGLPRQYYQDSSIYQEELEKIFSQRWLAEQPSPFEEEMRSLTGSSMIGLGHSKTPQDDVIGICDPLSGYHSAQHLRGS